MSSPTGILTFLFSDIEGSTRLWEADPVGMEAALARHDAIARHAVEVSDGTLVKTLGDGVHAVFADPVRAIGAALALQQALADPMVEGITLRVRCGLHLGAVERRDNDYFGTAVNRAARIMGAAHGGQVLVSRAVALIVGGNLPDGATLRDLGTVRLRDLADPEQVYQLLHPTLRAEFPALRSLEATPNNLPHQVSSFVGREREMAEVKRLLASVRLLTILGMGGLGKTRLSLQVAADVLDDYADGVWFVDLARLSDPQLVPQAVASTLGVKEEPGHSVQQALVAHVRDRQLLLVLDNSEHLVRACAELAKQLLQSGPRVKILATSRESLNIAGETAFPMLPLAVPASAGPIAAAALAQFDGARLFVDRAVAAHSAFRLSDRNASSVAEICRRVDGIPLAIELAAARVRTLSVEKIAERLADRFRLLTGGDKTAMPRQQTLRALIDWSHDLLSEHERALLRRLSVFAGGWTLEAAEAVGGGGAIDESDVLDLLTQLVEKSLVTREAEGGHYRLLDTVRQYAQEKLDESTDGDEARDRHLAFYLAFAERAQAGLVGPAQGEGLKRLDRERENILSAHAWCERAKAGAESDLRLLHATKLYWIKRGLLELGRRITVEALGRDGVSRRGPLRSRGLFQVGQFCALMGRYREAQDYLEESLAIARELGDKTRIAAVLQPLAMVSLEQRDFTAARAQLDEALVLARELGNPREVAAALTQAAALHRMQGDLDTAGSLYREVHTLAAGLGDQESVAIALLNLAMVAVSGGSGERAGPMLIEVLDIAGQVGSSALGQSVADVAAALAATRAQWESAARFYGVAEAQIALTGLHRDPGDEAFIAPFIADARKAAGAAAFSAAEASGRALAYDDAVREMRGWLTPAG
jgi:predicted ATPase/class 3 adenylate cyclase